VDWIAQNWVWILVGLAFVGMHIFGHGGHGGHGGGHGGGGGAKDKDAEPAQKPAPGKGEEHRH